MIAKVSILLRIPTHRIWNRNWMKTDEESKLANFFLYFFLRLFLYRNCLLVHNVLLSLHQHYCHCFYHHQCPIWCRRLCCHQNDVLFMKEKILGSCSIHTRVLKWFKERLESVFMVKRNECFIDDLVYLLVLIPFDK